MIRPVRTMYKCHVIFFVGETLDKVKEYAEKGGYDLGYPDEFYERVSGVRKKEYDGVTGFCSSGTCFIYIRSRKCFGAIVHEVEHASSHILWRAGIPHNDNTDEVFAYLQEFLINGLYEDESDKDKRES